MRVPVVLVDNNPNHTEDVTEMRNRDRKVMVRSDSLIVDKHFDMLNYRCNLCLINYLVFGQKISALIWVRQIPWFMFAEKGL